MTEQTLLWFKCARCNIHFMSYCYGKHKFHPDGDISFIDNKLGEILVFSHSDYAIVKGNYIYPIENKDYFCQRCRKGNDLLEY